MSRASFFDIVIRLRYNQRMYYKTRDHNYLLQAKDLESKVDREITTGKAYIDSNPDVVNQQGTRFSFFLLVNKMRYNQRQWYSTHDRQYLLASCELEKRVDAEIPGEYTHLNIVNDTYSSYFQELKSTHS